MFTTRKNTVKVSLDSNDRVNHFMDFIDIYGNKLEEQGFDTGNDDIRYYSKIKGNSVSFDVSSMPIIGKVLHFIYLLFADTYLGIDMDRDKFNRLSFLLCGNKGMFD
jgi:hypothetical protein